MTSIYRPLLHAAVAATVAAACAPAPPAEPAPRAVLSPAEVIDSLVSSPPLSRAHWGVLFVDARSGEPVYRRNADKLFITASNMKLVTVAAAMALLGPDYRFRTEARAPIGDEGTAPWLVVKGSGDPTFSKEYHVAPLAPLDSLADSLYVAGLRRVEGPLIVDLSRFGPPLVHPAWEIFDTDWYYAAPVAALAVAEGAVPVVVRPTAPGEPAAVEVLDLGGLVGVDADITTVAGDDNWDDQLLRLPHLDSLILRGTIGAEAGSDTSWIAQTAPGALAGRALARALERRGIELEGEVEVAWEPEAAPVAPPGSADGPAALATWTSPPLSELIRLPLQDSNNWVTEQLLRAIGAEIRGEGSWSDGTAAVEQWLAEVVGAPPGSLYMRDGSGLTAQNLITPEAVVALLQYVSRQPWADLFEVAMARPGARGTLERRLLDRQGRVAAKTGTIRHVNALSGYATTDGGRELIFSMLSNASGLPSSQVRPALDLILETILRGGT